MNFRYRKLKPLSDEFRSLKPEAVTVQIIIGWAGDFIRWAAVPLILSVLGVMNDAARKYIPSIRPYLTSGRPWAIGAICVSIALIAIHIFYRFTKRGRRRRLWLLLRLLRRYDSFSHEKEMEVISRIHSQTRAAALLFLLTLILMFPLAIAIPYRLAVAIVSDIVNSIKGTNIHPSFGPKLIFNFYGIVLGASFSWIVLMLDSARSESLLLSAKYRRKKIILWQTRIAKLRSQLRNQPQKKASYQSTSATA